MKTVRIRRVDPTSIYILAWLITQFGVMLASTEFVYATPGVLKYRYSLYVISGCLLAFKVFFCDKYRIRTLICIVLLLVLIGVVSFHSKGFSVILHSAFIVSVKSVDLKKLVKADLTMRISFLVILIALSSMGLINNYHDMINGRQKYAFGWLHPNVFGGHAITVLVELYYIIGRRIKPKTLVLYLAYTFLLWQICASRTSIYAFLIFLLFDQMRYTKTVEKSKTFETILIFIMPVCTCVSWILVWLYKEGTRLGIWINNVLSSRLTYSLRFLNKYSVSFFGKELYTVSTREHIRLGIRAEIFDMGYIRMFVEDGLVFSAFFLILYTCVQRNLIRYKMINEAFIVFFFSLIAIANTGLLSPFSNFSLLFISVVLKKNVPTKKNNQEYP